MKTYTETTIQNELVALQDWNFIENALEKKYVFKNFTQAMGFIVQVGIIASSFDHHPDWSNSYNKVHLKLSTHDAGGVTLKDIQLATAINAIL
ncbi:4a-hydroxytetrahydrobiopterin dehydratase [Flavobacterium sp. CHNK8]|uniref:4a-hydroxytetrahydrobiopterin dehydratase n=1 Tax=Flavobacterium sp. CHNK8 TaxID=2871165 RepID=UPI001C8E5F63|nr:4a-hydroxytetrahydrobiopterin dehydratase [Flavobacterium sp. CHNK8]QZK91221.1 4a-hydroxytetrahydrobiopterin dehydratase [Flavobacterium sp. CHNK8]